MYNIRLRILNNTLSRSICHSLPTAVRLKIPGLDARRTERKPSKQRASCAPGAVVPSVVDPFKSPRRVRTSLISILRFGLRRGKTNYIRLGAQRLKPRASCVTTCTVFSKNVQRDAASHTGLLPVASVERNNNVVMFCCVTVTIFQVRVIATPHGRRPWGVRDLCYFHYTAKTPPVTTASIDL